jgi:hypothetical protein
MYLAFLFLVCSRFASPLLHTGPCTPWFWVQQLHRLSRYTMSHCALCQFMYAEISISVLVLVEHW